MDVFWSHNLDDLNEKKMAGIKANWRLGKVKIKLLPARIRPTQSAQIGLGLGLLVRVARLAWVVSYCKTSTFSASFYFYLYEAQNKNARFCLCDINNRNPSIYQAKSPVIF